MAVSFALSIASRIEWAIGDLSGDDPTRPIARGVLSIADGTAEEADIPLEQQIAHALLEASQKDGKKGFKRFLDRIESIGISTLGVVDWRMGTLNLVPRKPGWVVSTRLSSQRASQIGTTCLIDFVSLFEGLFPKLVPQASAKPLPLIVHNDAVARGFLERDRLSGFDGSLFYLMLDEGVNGGMVWDEQTVPPRFNPEIGHIYPLLHSWDTKHFDPKKESGCPKHRFCYEGLASQTRIDATMKERPDNASQKQMWDAIALYGAQLALTGILMFAPQKVVIGGCVPDKNGRLVEHIRHWMSRLNGGYMPDLRGPLIDRVTMSDADQSIVNLSAALKLAQLANNPTSPLRVECS